MAEPYAGAPVTLSWGSPQMAQLIAQGLPHFGQNAQAFLSGADTGSGGAYWDFDDAGKPIARNVQYGGEGNMESKIPFLADQGEGSTGYNQDLLAYSNELMRKGGFTAQDLVQHLNTNAMTGGDAKVNPDGTISYTDMYRDTGSSTMEFWGPVLKMAAIVAGGGAMGSLAGAGGTAASGATGAFDMGIGGIGEAMGLGGGEIAGGLSGVDLINNALPGSIGKGLTESQLATSVFNPSYTGVLDAISPGAAFDLSGSVMPPSNGLNTGVPAEQAPAPVVDAARIATSQAPGMFPSIENTIASMASRAGIPPGTSAALSNLFSSDSVSGNSGGRSPAGSIFGGIGSAAFPSILGSLVNSGMGIYSGLEGLDEAERMRKLAEQAFKAQDPFGDQRSQYQKMLLDLMMNPDSVKNRPGYQFGMNEGRRAIERRGAASGSGGNEAIALARYTPEYASKFWGDEVSRLSGLAGAGITPSGGNALLQGNQYASDLASRALASIGYGTRRLI